MGGSWEPTVKITKIYLTNITKNKPMTYEALVTFLAELEATLNSRPLTQTPDNVNDFDVMTPNHFVLGKKSLFFSPDRSKMITWQAELAGNLYNANKDVLEVFNTRISTNVTIT